MLKDKRRLTAAVLLSCSFFMAPYYAHAEEEEYVPDCGHGKNYMDISVSNGTNQLTYKFDIYTASTHPGPHWWGEYKEDDDGDPVFDEDGNKVKEYVSYRDLFAGEQEAFGDSIGYIHQMINPTASVSPYINLELLPDEDADAAAESSTYVEKDDDGKPKTQISDTELGAVLQGKYLPSGDDPVARIEVNLAPPDTIWYIDKFTALPSNGTDSDYYGTITHEMFHALGLGTYLNENTSANEVTFGTNVNYEEGDGLLSQAVFNKYEMGLRDAFGRVGYYEYNSNGNNVYYDRTTGDNDATLKYPINPNEENPLSGVTGELVSRNIVPITLAQYNDPDFVKRPDEFYVIRDGSESTNCGAYFIGENVKAVLNGASIAWPDDSTIDPVCGIPLNGYEDSDDSKPELSHLELQNGLMSHQSYRNWCNFMEVELALLKDLGYNVDLGAYYGKSIYNSGTESVPFEVNNSIGFDKNTTHGTGLHVYGSYVNVTQSAALNASGYSGIGIRVDGANNKLAINSNISVNGQYGNGLLVAYGKEHEVSLESDKTISATGDGGVAARFDFGSNELGDTAGYRGSYINVEYDDKNAKWVEKTIPTAIQGPLVSTFNVDGTLNGKLAAIYISPNALVKEININNGATITGNIVSEWNPKAIIYQNNDSITFAPKLPVGEDGLTSLNFNANIRYDSNIIGKESIVANVKSKKLSFNGTADVCGFNVNAGATLGGNGTINLYKYNESTFEYDLGAGTFANEGTIAPGNSIGTLTINGNYTQGNDASIDAEITGDGTSDKIIVNGEATINGKINLIPISGYFSSDPAKATKVQIVENASNDNAKIHDNSGYAVVDNNPILSFNVTNEDNTCFSISVNRDLDAYGEIGKGDAVTSGIANALALNADSVTGDAAKLVGAIEFSGSREDIANNMRKLNPSVYSNSAQATINTHSMLNNMNMLGTFSSLNVPPARTGGGRGPAVNETPKYNAWRNMVMPFTSYTDQHNGNRGYTNHNSGVIGAMERTLENGLTHGYHAALNHQSTSEAGSRIKGEGLYLGTQATYAPADWKGWQVFGSARLGIEQMRSHRNINIGGYSGVADSDWTGYSGSLSVGTALSKEHGIMESGPFAALDYSFAHRPSIHEDGGAISTKISSATYDSLRTQLGYRLTTKPKALDGYDSTKWQAHASVAWNHELLGDNGRTSYQFSDLPGVTISDTVNTYGRDSLSLAAGVTFKTPKRLDVTLTIGSDMYRKGGSSVYGKANFEWKF